MSREYMSVFTRNTDNSIQLRQLTQIDGGFLMLFKIICWEPVFLLYEFQIPQIDNKFKIKQIILFS